MTNTSRFKLYAALLCAAVVALFVGGCAQVITGVQLTEGKDNDPKSGATVKPALDMSTVPPVPGEAKPE